MKNKRRKNYAIIGGIILLILVISATYAYFMVTNGTGSQTPINLTSNTTDSLIFNVSKDITLTANMSNFNSTSETGKSQKDDAVATATLRANNKDNEVSKSYYLYLDIIDNELTYSLDEDTPELILQIKAPGASNYLTASDVASMGGTLKDLTYKSDVVDKNGESYPGFDITGYEGLITIADNRPIEVEQGTQDNTVTESWEVRIVFVNYNDNQTNNGGKTVNAKLMMQSEREVRTVMIGAYDYDNDRRYFNLIWKYGTKTTKIVFEDTTNERVMDSEINGGVPFDISKDKDGTVLAYIEKGTELVTEGYDSNGNLNYDYYYDEHGQEFPAFYPYTIYIQTEGKKIILSDGYKLFENFYNLKEIEGLTRLDTSRVKNMANMFNGCKSLTTLDLSSFDTSRVTNMQNMFNYCEHLTSLNLSSFNTNKVTNMVSMFNNCSSLTLLDLSSFNTSNVENMSYIFKDCSSLTTLDLSLFDTSKVTLMSYMFFNCIYLEVLDLSGFNTSNVTNTTWMFMNCYNLTTIYVSEYNPATNKGWTMKSVPKLYDGSMFSSCDKLKGGQGTGYNSSHIGKEYAHIDEEGNPGYLTDIKDKTN